MRCSGTSFARIARSLGMAHASDANAAFHRALNRRPAAERQTIRQAEFGRLDALEQRVRADDALTDDRRDKQLHTLNRLRDRLLAD